jgi:hypothetical protein
MSTLIMSISMKFVHYDLGPNIFSNGLIFIAGLAAVYACFSQLSVQLRLYRCAARHEDSVYAPCVNPPKFLYRPAFTETLIGQKTGF